MQSPESKPKPADVLASRLGDDDDMSVYDDIPAAAPAPAHKEDDAGAAMADAQDNYFENREPAELIFCVILAAAYAGLARYCWEPLQITGEWGYFISVEGFFSTMALLSLVLGLRPYLSPSSLQISNHGIKYRGPYWPQRKTVNWNQIFRLYLSPDLAIVLYHPPDKPKGFRFLFIQCNYLSDRAQIMSRFSKYAPVQPVYLRSPEWYIKGTLLLGYLSIVCWILYMLGNK